MNKILIAAAAAFFAVTALFGSGAQAGFNVRLAAPAGFATLQKAGCHGGYFRSYRRRYHRSVRRHHRRRVHVARKHSSVSVAKAEPKTETKTEAKTVVSENSSISTANGKVAEAKPVETGKPEKKVVASKNLGCKQFFPSVGMTLTVSCE